MKKNKIIDHVPGPIEEAAVRIYFERGSQIVVDLIQWKKIALVSGAISLILAIAIAMMVPLKSIEIVKVSQDSSGKMKVVESGQTDQNLGIADQDAQMAFVAQWASDAFEINDATWRRNVTRAAAKTSGASKDQLNDYLMKEANNPVLFMQKDKSFVREIERVSINVIQSNVVLMRYRQISRAGNSDKTIKNYAATFTLKNVNLKSREEVIDNPSGLVVHSFSISDESTK